MTSIFGIELTAHQMFELLKYLTLICSAMFVGGLVLDKWAEHKYKYDLCLVGCYMAVFGGIGVIVFSMLAGCFK